jgi:hypothetical protein
MESKTGQEPSVPSIEFSHAFLNSGILNVSERSELRCWRRVRH